MPVEFCWAIISNIVHYEVGSAGLAEVKPLQGLCIPTLQHCNLLYTHRCSYFLSQFSVF